MSEPHIDMDDDFTDEALEAVADLIVDRLTDEDRRQDTDQKEPAA